MFTNHHKWAHVDQSDGSSDFKTTQMCLTGSKIMHGGLTAGKLKLATTLAKSA